MLRSATPMRSPGTSDWTLPAVLLGLLVAMTALWLEDIGPRYLVFGTVAALLVPVILAVPDHRRFFLSVLLLSLQCDAAIRFMYRGTTRSSGWSGPTAFEFPVAFFPAAILFLITSSTARTQGGWDWGGRVGRWGLLVAASVALSLGVSSERFFTFCSIFQVAQFLMIFLAVLNAVRDRDDIALTLRLIVAVLVTQSVVYLVETSIGATFSLSGDVFERSGEMGRHGGTVGTTPSTFAAFMHPLIQITLAQFLTGTGRGGAWRLFVAGLGTLVMLLTYTRAAWVGMALGVGVVVALGVNRKMIAPRRVFLLVLFAFAALAVVYPKMATRVANNAADSEERWGLMRIAWSVIRAHPILGVGAGTYTFAFSNYVPKELLGTWLFVVHNAYLLRWAETGLVGVICYLMFLYCTLGDGLKLSQSGDRDLAIFGIGWTGGLVALLWEMWWDTSTAYAPNGLVWALAGFAAAAWRIDRKARATAEALPRYEGSIGHGRL